MTFSFFTSCHSKPVDPDVPEVIIIEPEVKETTAALADDGSASVTFNNFSFNEISDKTKLSVSGSFACEPATFQYSITNFDGINKNFSVQIDIQNVQPVEHLKGKFTFNYDGKVIAQQPQSEFDISLYDTPQVYLPEIKTSESQIHEGNVCVTFEGFTCSNIVDRDLLSVYYSGQPTLGRVDRCTIIFGIENYFKVCVYFVGVAAETVNGYFTFQYGSSLIDVPQDNFSCVLQRDWDKPDFETDDWVNVIDVASNGLSDLQEYYGVANFVGLTRTVTISNDIMLEKQYPVTVVGQNQDCYVDTGLRVPLTFQFDNVISTYEGEDYVPTEIDWDPEDDTPWYNPEDDTSCNLRKFLNENFMDRIDPNVVEGIKPVRKITISKEPEVGDEPEYIESKDKLWCFSPSEVGIVPGQPLGYDEGECYQYYEPDKGLLESELRYATDITSGEILKWWCRSPYEYGNVKGGIGLAHRKSPVRPCFCI